MHIKDYFGQYLSQEELDDFGLWAFGIDDKLFDRALLMENWNKLHGNKYTLMGDGRILEDTKKMVDLYKVTKEEISEE